MLIAASWTNTSIDILGVVALVAGIFFVLFGTRAKVVAGQQRDSIDALESRLTVVESENRELKEKDLVNQKVIGALQTQITQLTEKVTQKAAVEQLDRKIDARFDAVYKHLNIPLPTGAKQ